MPRRQYKWLPGIYQFYPFFKDFSPFLKNISGFFLFSLFRKKKIPKVKPPWERGFHRSHTTAGKKILPIEVKWRIPLEKLAPFGVKRTQSIAEATTRKRHGKRCGDATWEVLESPG